MTRLPINSILSYSMSEKTTLIKNADYVITMNDNREILENTSLLISGNRIVECPTQVTEADEIIDATHKLVFPGFVNTHHHFFQTGFRFVPEMQSAPLGQWVKILGERSKNFNEQDWYNCSATSLAELVLSGCTTTADHCYLIPHDRNDFFDQEVRAAKDLGVRFHPVRGSMTLSANEGTIFPPHICQSLDMVIREIQRVIDTHHDPSSDSMCHVAAGPCFPVFPVSSSEEEMKEVMRLCRVNGVRMHTHAAEEIDEFDYTVQKTGKTPIAYLESIGCLGQDVWLAHCIFLTRRDIEILAATNTAIASCPSANSRGAGIAKVTEYLQAGIPVGVGVDGAAGNDTSNIQSELRMLRTLQGAREGVLNSYLIDQDPKTRCTIAAELKGTSYLNIDRLFEVGTLHGAKALGRENVIGSLEAGKLADIAIFDDHAISHAGAFFRPGSLFSCSPLRAWHVMINGKTVVMNGELRTADEETIISNQQRTTEKLRK